MRRNMFILTLLLALAVFSIAPVIAQCEPPVEICKTPFCMHYYPPGTPGAPEPGGEGDTYSTNPIAMDDGIPVYPTGTKLFWWIKITVTANVALEDVVVYDRLGAEFMVEGIYVGDAGMPDLEPPYTYTFVYDGIDPTTTPITYGQGVHVDSILGTVDKGDMFKGTEGGIDIEDDYDFRIFWTGNSCKVHFMWTIGDLDAGETATIYLVISTDRNPAGIQEFTSCGTYFLNSGATVKGFLNGRKVSAEANPIEIKAVDII